jgi:hypothetical protein
MCRPDAGEPQGYDIGCGYNELFWHFDPDCWLCVMDQDVCQTTRTTWDRLLRKAIGEHPEAGAFCAMTNRLMRWVSSWQMVPEEYEYERDIVKHFALGARLAKEHGTKTIDVTDIEQAGHKPLSGMAFVIQQKAWMQIGPITRIRECDWEIHRRLRAAGRRVYLLPGWYVFHWSHWEEPYGKEIKG